MLIQISAGHGQAPIESKRAVYLYYLELLKEYSSLEVISINGTKDTASSVVLYTDEDLSHLEGTVQWICKSPYRPHHKRKNWFIDVSVLKEKIRLDKAEDVRFEVCRASGAGGQHVNKTNSAVKATHIPTGICAVSMDQRSQIQNRKVAYLRLLKKLEDENVKTNQSIEYENWNNHNSIIRGNPIRIYEGEKFRRKI